MNRYLRLSFAVAVCVFVFGAAFLAQAQAQAPPPAPPATIKLQIVLSRYEGDKKINSVPYSLSLFPGEGGSIRAGAEIAVVSNPPAYTMQQVGTQIDATASPTPDGKFKLNLSVTDRSIVTGPPQGGVSNVPTFRNMISNSKAVLGNGETMQFTSSSDRSSNETFKIDVTLTVGNK